MKDNINNTIKDTKKATLSIFDSLLEIIAHIILHASATKRKFIHKIDWVSIIVILSGSMVNCFFVSLPNRFLTLDFTECKKD
jgi:predicted membrane channel-forming protein YqfA (hemolysin III family)